jgi:YhcN/YlaJ family sporulation lipoprotein
VNNLKKLHNKMSILLLCIFYFAVAIGGCTQAKKPLNPTPIPGQGPTSNYKPTTPSVPNSITMQSEADRQSAQKLANLATEVNGVKKATVILAGKNALCGLTLNKNVKGKMIDDVKKKVTDKITKSDSSLTRVNVVTDAAMVSQINQLSKDIDNNKPMKELNQSFTNLMNQLKQP